MDQNDQSPPPTDPTISSALPPSFPSIDPVKIGRYRVVRLLGKGGFGRVYLAHDDELDRAVAVKVPNTERISTPEDVESFLVEAKVLARLEHPNIVPVYDAGRSDDGLCYVVSKFLRGSDLKERILQGRPSVSRVGGADGRGRRGLALCAYERARAPGCQAGEYPAR